MKVKAPAKINLNLHVLPQKDKAGLYNVKYVNCQVSLFDEIILEKQPEKIEVSCQYEDVCRCEKKDFCRGQKNLVLKAAEILKNKFGSPELGAEILIQKKIPPAAGLGGGSADAAAALKGLNKLWQLGLSLKSLLEIAQELGMDVSYCLVGGLCLVQGTKGEKIKQLNFSLPKMRLVIVIPKEEKPSTGWAFKNLPVAKIGKKTDKGEKLIKAIKANDIFGITDNLHNDFESLIVKKFPVVRKIKKELLQTGALNAILTGAGLAVIGFFKDRNQAEKAYRNLSCRDKKVFLNET